MNETLDNLTIQETISQFQTDMIKDYTNLDIFLGLSLAILLTYFSYLVYKNSKKIYEFSNYESINYFKKAFFFFLTISILNLIYEIFILYSVKFLVNSIIFITITTLVLSFYALFHWIANVFLIQSILWKFVSNYLNNKFVKKIFTFFILILIFINYLIYFGISIFNKILGISYMILIYFLVFYFIVKNSKSKKIFLQPHYLGVLLIFILNIFNSIVDLFFFQEKFDYIFYFIDASLFLIYFFIAKRLNKWAEVFVK